jgi:hypothetical protein
MNRNERCIFKLRWVPAGLIACYTGKINAVDSFFCRKLK